MTNATSYQDDNVWMFLVAIVACVFSFISVYVSGRNYDVHRDGWSNNYDVSDPCLREACRAALFMVLCPTFATLLEFVPLLPKSKGESDAQRQDVINGKLNTTLTLAEKSLFVMGILCLSVLYPTLPDINTDLVVRISISFFNCSTTLMVCAILRFLCRRSTSFTQWNTQIIVVLVCVAGVISSCALIHDDAHSTQANVLFLASDVLFDVAALVYGGSCLLSLIRWFRLRGNKVEDVNAKDGQGGNVQPKGNSGLEEDTIKQLVVGSYMFSTFVVMAVNAVARWFTASLTVYQLSIIIYIMLSTALLVFVFDSFARFHITLAAMCALLDAKTDYVRYISHEIRTPLSATLMGLRLMLDDFKRSRPRPGSVDADRLDTLKDINSSCVAALDILNDLLCFNKLEAGLLELHKETVCPGAFVKESVAMFNVQARDSGVVLSVVLNRPPGDNDGDGGNGNDDNDDGSVVSLTRSIRRVLNNNNLLQRRGSSGSSGGRIRNDGRVSLASVSSCLLLESDTISLDKFKLDQVIRNLVSNAIKFSPRGGAVTVYAYFDSEPIPVTASVAAQNTTQLSVVEGRDKDKKRGSFLDWTDRGGGSVVGARSALRRSMVRMLSNERMRSVNSPVPPNEGAQDSITPPVPATTTKLGKLVVVVTDNGPGISAENQKRLFKEVVQFSPEKLQAGGGSGFGLFITKSIVDLHEGTIGVFSAGEGKGTSFTLELPMSRTTTIATTRNNPAADLRVEMMMMQQQQQSPGTELAATATRSASAAKRGQTFAAATGIRISRGEHQSDSRLSVANSSAPAALNTLGQELAAAPHPVTDPPGRILAVATPPRLLAVDSRLDAVRQALDDQLGSGLPISRSRSGSPHSVVFPPGGGRKGSVMLRELSRHDALNPQCGSVSYSVASGNKRGMYLGSPMMSPHNHRSPAASVDASVVSVGGEESAPLVVVAGGPPGANVSALPKWDILVVDDSPLNRKMLAKTLRAAGHTCEEAGNGREGVDMVQRRAVSGATPYDVILMDFVMPVMDGPTATKTMRTAKELQYTGPIIGLTGNAMPADINHFMAHGASAVLVKPIDMAIFNATMKQLNAAK